MEDFVKYIYNIKIEDYRENSGIYYIKSGQENYMLVTFFDNPINLYKKYIFLKRNNVFCYDIIFNRYNEIVSDYKSKQYILFKKNIVLKKYITIIELCAPTPIFEYKNQAEVKNKWELKNDYYESILEKSCSNSLELFVNFDYYLGLGELAISLLNYINFDNIPLYAQHIRLKCENCIKDYYDPRNIIVDSRIRDISFYIKDTFFENDISISEIKTIIEKMVLNNDEALLFFARMLYPDYYFDICDDILNKNVNNFGLKKCIKKNIQYEIFLKSIYQCLNKIYNFPSIQWLSIK